jgi:hypothetical protein
MKSTLPIIIAPTVEVAAHTMGFVSRGCEAEVESFETLRIGIFHQVPCALSSLERYHVHSTVAGLIQVNETSLFDQAPSNSCDRVYSLMNPFVTKETRILVSIFN